MKRNKDRRARRRTGDVRILPSRGVSKAHRVFRWDCWRRIIAGRLRCLCVADEGTVWRVVDDGCGCWVWVRHRWCLRAWDVDVGDGKEFYGSGEMWIIKCGPVCGKIYDARALGKIPRPSSLWPALPAITKSWSRDMTLTVPITTITESRVRWFSLVLARFLCI